MAIIRVVQTRANFRPNGIVPHGKAEEWHALTIETPDTEKQRNRREEKAASPWTTVGVLPPTQLFPNLIGGCFGSLDGAQGGLTIRTPAHYLGRYITWEYMGSTQASHRSAPNLTVHP